MYTTYYIEDCNGNIIAYWTSLKEAKRYFLFISSQNAENEYIAREDLRIVQLKGQYKFEGRHIYYMTFENGKFKKQIL